MKKSLFFIALYLIVFSAFAQTNTIFVSPTGSDSNTGEESSPYKTIQFAVDQASNGDSIKVESGTYIENIYVNKGLHISSISDSESTIIDGNESGRCVEISSYTGGNITFEGFSLKNGLASYGGGINITSNQDTVKISKLNIYSHQGSYNGGGMYVTSSNSGVVLIDACRVSENETVSYGGGIFAEGDNIIITNCLIDNNYTQLDGGGVSLNGKIKMINNTITKNSINQYRYGAGICIESGLDSLLLMNNIVFGNYGGNDIYVFNGKLVIYNNYLGSIPNNVKSEGNIISYDNPFIDSENGDFALIDNSPAIGSGIISATLEGKTFLAPEYDYFKNIRPNPSGSNPDMGAIESGYTLGVDNEELTQGLKMYPNPATETLLFESKLPIVKVEIYSLTGKKIKDIHTNFKAISTDNMRPGIYMVKIYSEKGVAVRKLVKQ